MRSFKDENIQNKQVDYNSNQLSYSVCILDHQNFFKYVTILAGKL